MFQQALNAPTVALEELFWTNIIDEFGGQQDAQANWANDLVSRAIGNRGNARARQVRRWAL